MWQTSHLFIMDILNFINTVGFPIFVAVFFLVKLDKTLQNIGNSVDELTNIIKERLLSKGE
ncbi:YvrJ family protein [Gemella bergeri]|nr:YvrJ family protein [Gemella bergeri]